MLTDVIDVPSDLPNELPANPPQALHGLLRDRFVEACIAVNDDLIEQDSHLVDIERRTFETQVRLHLPAVRDLVDRTDGYREAYRRVRLIAVMRAAQIRQELDRAELRANASLLIPKDYRTSRELALVANDGSRLRLDFRPTDAAVGHVYQSKLHYLRCARADTWLQFGLFLPGASHPLTYAALSTCDRRYIADGVLASRLHCEQDECLVVTRMYGLPGIPANLMSLTLKHVIRSVRRMGRFKLLLTAYNPLLGFTGSALHASGFRPFALAPVTYRYTDRGEFTTRRRTSRDRGLGEYLGHNVLTARGVDRTSQRELTEIRMTRIPSQAYRDAISQTGALPDIRSESWRDSLRRYRKLLETGWSSATIHPSYLDDPTDRPASRGQCGVSSVWLAKELRREHGIEATYCYGDLLFDDASRDAVAHHCWVELGDEHDPDRIVIDLTYDQADPLSEPVLCEYYSDLRNLGHKYAARTRLTLDELDDDRVWHRFLALRRAIGPDATP